MSAATRARSASVAATTRSRWSWARVASRASGRTVNRPATRIRPIHSANGKRYGLVSVARATSGVAPAIANSVDFEEPAARGRGAEEPARLDRPGGGQARDQRDRPDQCPARDARARPRLRERQADADDDRADDAGPDRLGDEPSLLRIRDPVVESDGERDHGQCQQDPADRDEWRRPGRLERSQDERHGRRDGQRDGEWLEARPRPAARQPPPGDEQDRRPEEDRRHRIAHAAPAVVEDRAPGSSRCATVPVSRSHGWIAWRLRIGAAMRATSWSAGIATSVGSVGSTPIGCGCGTSPVSGSGLGSTRGGSG